jgi:hypothetical protein
MFQKRCRRYFTGFENIASMLTSQEWGPDPNEPGSESDP